MSVVKDLTQSVSAATSTVTTNVSSRVSDTVADAVKAVRQVRESALSTAKQAREQLPVKQVSDFVEPASKVVIDLTDKAQDVVTSTVSEITERGEKLVRDVVGRRPAVKRAPARKATATKRTPAKKPAAKRATAKRTPAKRTPAKRTVTATAAPKASAAK